MSPAYRVSSPVVFFIFKRFEETQRVFDKIRQARPAKLLVVADGARPDINGEIQACNLTREIIKQVDWECDVLLNFSEINLGCRNRIASGIKWAFEQVEHIIVLEDDCLPDISFFQFCDSMLSRYKNDERVGAITGLNIDESINSSESYFFSKYAASWGWASWKRAWSIYDVDLKSWRERKRAGAHFKLSLDWREALIYQDKWDQITIENFGTWDYQWDYMRFFGEQLCIVPTVNLIKNIGFGEVSTHTQEVDPSLIDLKISPLVFPITHPENVARNLVYEKAFYEKFIKTPLYRLPLRALRRLYRHAKKR